MAGLVGDKESVSTMEVLGYGAAAKWVFRDRPAEPARRSADGGPDVREVIRSVKSARASEPDLDPGCRVFGIDQHRRAGTPDRHWLSATGSAYPDGMTLDRRVQSFEEQALLAWVTTPD